MSASLVGSEMCIRDRARAAPRCRGLPEEEAGWRGELPRASPLARGAPPVSYTHLTLPTICSV
eukprot:2116868-Alexandrium_andersonii.AAC.1